MARLNWLSLICCLAAPLLASCATGESTTPSGSESWSRGRIVGTTRSETVAVAEREGKTLVIWIAMDGRLRLAQLNSALGLESMADLPLKATSPYARDLHLESDADGWLHLIWEDTVDGTPAVVYVRFPPGQIEPSFQQKIPLPADSRHIETVLRPDTDRLELFWSDISTRNSGIHHQAVSLARDMVAPARRLTNTGRQPGPGWGPSGAMHLAWVDEAPGSYVGVWHAQFDPERQALRDPSEVARVEWKRGVVFQGPVVGRAGPETVVAWSTGKRGVVMGMGDVYTGGLIGGAAPPLTGSPAPTPAVTDYGDRARYVTLAGDSGQMVSSPKPLTGGPVVGAWRAPRLRIAGDQTWVVLSGLVKCRSHILSQVTVVPFHGQTRGEPVPVTATRLHSVWPDLTVGADGTLQVAWLEPAGDGEYKVAVASSDPEAIEALGGFHWADWWSEAATVGFEGLSLLIYTPLVISWMILPMALVALVAFVSHGNLRALWALAWLWVAMLLQLVCKGAIAPKIPSLHDPLQVGLALVPAALAAILVWIYWRRVMSCSLIKGYALFAGLDAVYSLFVLLPLVLWTS